MHKRVWCVQRTESRSVWLEHTKRSDERGKAKEGAVLGPTGPSKP